MPARLEDLPADPLIIPLMDPTNLTRPEKALYWAVLHHGMANLTAVEMTPASKQTVTVTADFFLHYLKQRSSE